MCDYYMRELLRVSVAQICQTIGYNATQTMPLELLQDTLHKFLHEFCRDLRRQSEHYHRTEANLNDTFLTLNTISINVSELLDYVTNVEPVAFTVDVPKFPIHKESNLNFLKPGSKEVLIRPVHIYEHLPPILPSESNNVEITLVASQYLLNENLQTSKCIVPGSSLQTNGDVSITYSNQYDESNAYNDVLIGDKSKHQKHVVSKTNTHFVSGSNGVAAIRSSKECAESVVIPTFFKASPLIAGHILDEEGHPTREISSVVMTTGGFISPAIEGKLPDTIIPDLIDQLLGLDAPPPPATLSRLGHCTSTEDKSISHKNNKGIDNEISNTQLNKPILDEVNISQDEKMSLPIIKSHNMASSSTNLYKNDVKKKNIPFIQNTMHAIQNPTIASKLLKKAKKKSPNAPLSRNDYTNSIAGGNININKMQADKTQKKCRKMLQKLTKSGKTLIGDGIYKEYLNPAMIAAMPPGSQRDQLEKLLKKQNKQKQKLLKLQKAIELKNIPNFNINSSKGQTFASDCVSFSVKDTPSEILSSTVNNIQPNNNRIPNNSKALAIKAFDTSPSKSTCQSTILPQIVMENLEFSLKSISEVSKAKSIDLNDKNTSIEIKLSTEPDKSKLNIFKKISKQKVSKSVSPNINKITLTPIYASTDSQIINLPSGTTITPAPPVDTHNFSPDGKTIDELSDATKSKDMQISGIQKSSIISGVSLFERTSEYLTNIESLNKPKKRGRKPGSKNHSKIPVSIALPITSIKKTKKIKLDKSSSETNIYGQHELLEPLNLTNPNQFGNSSDFASLFPMGISKSFTDQSFIQAQVKERKERKKLKSKILPSSPLSSDSNLNLPTKEEVHSINKKLLRMDTVLKAAPPILPLVTPHSKEFLNVELTKVQSPNTSLKSPGSNKSGLQKCSPNLVSSNMNSCFIPPVGTGFSTNLLSMMPIYPFPTRPGLIPSSGLFPAPGLGNFSNNSTNNTTPNMLIPRFLNFHNLKPPAPDNTEYFTEPTPQAGDRSYCNVAPLVPDNMKLTPPESKQARPTSTLMERGYPKTPKMRQSPTFSERVSESILNRLDEVNTPDSISAISKSIPPTPGGISVNTFEALTRKNLNRPEVSPTKEEVLQNICHGQAFDTKSLKSNMYAHGTDTLLNKNNISEKVQPPTTFMEEPIEVSDDSGDAIPKPSSMNSTLSIGKTNNIYIKPSLIGPVVSHMEDIFTPNMTLPETASAIKDSKKFKKYTKFAKKTNCLNPIGPLSIDIFGSENSGVGKLAGGADLIPLAGTGLSYSSKTIPSTSLTASTTPSTFSMHKREFGTKTVFDNLTITTAASSSTDLQQNKKDQKKFKKINEGKVKKKKDKKIKTKSKDRIEKHLGKPDKVLKEKLQDKINLKRLKKDKKKEKQRLTMDSLSSATNTMINDTIGLNTTNTCNEELSIIPQSPSSYANITTPSSLVPKLTLKLGNCQSTILNDNTLQKSTQKIVQRDKKELSPELARFSPLVTRPPKQKSNIGDASNSYATALAAPSAESASHSESLCDKAIPTFNSTSTHSLIPPPSPWLAGGTLTASSVLLPQQLLQTPKAQENTPTVVNSADIAATSSSRPDRPVPVISEASRPSSYIDAEGNRVWICPACGKVDDGSAMIGCDGCDAWYHWVCVGIFVAPKDNEDWFCRVCITRKKGIDGIDKKRKRNKKK